MNWIEVTALVFSGIMVGFINTLAGGGSIISLSLLMFLGLPANVANGTNRIAVLFQNLATVASFRQQRVLEHKKGIMLGIPALLGSVLGAYIAVDLNKEIIEKAIAIIMLLMLFFILYKPQQMLKEREWLTKRKTTPLQLILFFIIGIYGGFIQMGVGYFLLAGLVINAGFDLVKANALKVLIVLMFTPLALLVFIFNGQVNYAYGLTLAIGTIAGGFIASRMAVKKGANFVRWVIVIVILLSVARIFGWISVENIFAGIK